MNMNVSSSQLSACYFMSLPPSLFLLQYSWYHILLSRCQFLQQKVLQFTLPDLQCLSWTKYNLADGIKSHSWKSKLYTGMNEMSMHVSFLKLLSFCS